MKRRGLIWGALLVLGFIGTSLGVVYWRFTNLPHPRDATHNQLMYWVVLRDLNQFDHDVQLSLVDRFAEEATEIFGKNKGASGSLTQAQSDRLLQNIEILKQVWFQNRIDQYCSINSPKACETFLDKQIQLLDDFGNIAFEHAKILYPDKADENLTTISDELFADIDKWLTETPAEKKTETLQAVREATVFWLATQDLGVQLLEARKELVTRVIAELEKGMDLGATTSIVSDERAEQLRKNAVLLMEAWVHILSNQYDELPTNERVIFVDSKIDDVKRWKLMEYLAGDSEAKVSPMQGIAKFNKTFGEWVDHADEEMKPKLKKLKTAFQQRILMSMFKTE